MTISSLLLLGILFAFLLWFCLWVRYAGKSKLVGESSDVFDFLRHSSFSLWYFPHFRIGLIPSINSALALTISRERTYRPKREILKGADGGEFGLDWFTLKGELSPDIDDNLPNDAPVLVIAHGMSGGSSERYVQKIGLRVRREFGWRSACVLFRGCCGTRITTTKIYHGGHTEDLHIALQHIRSKYPSAPILLISYSLGANVMIKYLGEQSSRTQERVQPAQVSANSGIVSNIVAAVAVGCPYNLAYSVVHYSVKQQTEMGKVLLRFLLKHRAVLDADPRFAGSVDRFIQQKDFRVTQFDNMFTSQLAGYKDGQDYYTDASCDQYMDGVHTPLLCISSRNDPVSLFGAFPRKQIEANPNIGAIIVPGGAHLGFFRFNNTRTTFDEDAAIEFFKYELSEQKAASTMPDKKVN